MCREGFQFPHHCQIAAMPRCFYHSQPRRFHEIFQRRAKRISIGSKVSAPAIRGNNVSGKIEGEVKLNAVRPAFCVHALRHVSKSRRNRHLVAVRDDNRRQRCALRPGHRGAEHRNAALGLRSEVENDQSAGSVRAVGSCMDALGDGMKVKSLRHGLGPCVETHGYTAKTLRSTASRD